MYFCSFVSKSNQTSTKYSPDVYNSFYRTIPYYFHKTSPSPLKRGFPKFHYKPLRSLASQFFSSRNSKSPPKDAQYFNRSWQASLHVIFLLQTKFSFRSLIFPPKWNTPSKVYAVSTDPGVPFLT